MNAILEKIEHNFDTMQKESKTKLMYMRKYEEYIYRERETEKGRPRPFRP